MECVSRQMKQAPEQTFDEFLRDCHCPEASKRRAWSYAANRPMPEIGTSGSICRNRN